MVLAVAAAALLLGHPTPALPAPETLVAPTPVAPAPTEHRPGAAENAARTVTCAGCLVLDDTGAILWARAARAPRANASTTKMLTALLVARHGDLGAPVLVSAHAAATGGGGLDLQPGELYSTRDLLRALLLTSSNDAAVALAEHVAGSEATFVRRMNRLAPRLGAHQAHFVTPHGLDRPGHRAAPLDLARIAEALLARPVLARTVAAPEATIEGPSGTIMLENRNVLLDRYRGAIGVKTGFTDDAGEVLVAAAERHGRRLIAVAMDSEDAARDGRRLLDLGFRRLAHSVLLAAGAPVAGLVFDPGGSTRAAAARTVRGSADPREVEVLFRPARRVEPSLDTGDAVGTVALRARGRRLASVRAILARPLPPRRPVGALELLGSLLRFGHRLTSTVARW
ncbi:MAG: D-alanyl-D-alanine carboxypeptidase family protein [Actinomycetota bacterium]